jgi:hypothetical protein
MSKKTRKLIVRIYSNKELRNEFLKFYLGNVDFESISKLQFYKIWTNKFIDFSNSILFDLFDSLDIKIGILPSKEGSWTFRILSNNEMFIFNECETRQEAVEKSLDKALEIFKKNQKD